MFKKHKKKIINNKNHITMNNFKEKISSNTPTLVDFYADWCGPCKMLSPVIEKVAKKMEGKVNVLKVDVDKNQQVAMEYEVMSIPTMILFHEGKIVWKGVGFMSEDQIAKVIDEHLQKKATHS